LQAFYLARDLEAAELAKTMQADMAADASKSSSSGDAK